jgi:hypothetical protein
LTGFSFSIPDAEIQVITHDGGHAIETPVGGGSVNSVGVLYPAERVDFVVSWPKGAEYANSQLTIALDHE